MRRASSAIGRGGVQPTIATRVRGKKGFGELWTKQQQQKKKDDNSCPCGGGREKRSYRNCCAPYHEYKKQAETPDVLLRTRFSAYAKGKVEYVVNTTHRDNPAQVGSVVNDKQLSTFQADVRATCKRVKFTELNILQVEQEEEADQEADEAYVTFTCKATVTGQKGTRGTPETMHERSKFVRENGTWTYLDGEVKWT